MARIRRKISDRSIEIQIDNQNTSKFRLAVHHTHERHSRSSNWNSNHFRLGIVFQVGSDRRCENPMPVR